METINFKYLQWDSDFFQARIYKYELEENSFREYLLKANSNFADLIYIFSKRRIHFYDIPNFFLADEKITYHKTIKPKNCYFDKECVFQTNQINSELISLALISGKYSRFRIDTKLSSKFENLYTIWITRSLNGEVASAVFVYKFNDRIVGFVTVKVVQEIATIGLIATDETHQGRGIGSSLIKHLERWCYEQNVKDILVATQAKNKVACKFYEKNDYQISNIEYIYHHHLS